MIRILSILALGLVALPAMAFDGPSQVAIDALKRGKKVPYAQLTALMLQSEKWCYSQKGTECAWSDIYLAIEDDTVSFELSHPWDEATDITYIGNGGLSSDGFICYIGHNWIPSMRAYAREDGFEIGGRELFALKQQVDEATDLELEEDCFDYLFEASDDAAETVTLVQRQWVDGVTDPANDVTVTLHFDKATAENLRWYL